MNWNLASAAKKANAADLLAESAAAIGALWKNRKVMMKLQDSYLQQMGPSFRDRGEMPSSLVGTGEVMKGERILINWIY
jgi:hypothetical protein